MLLAWTKMPWSLQGQGCGRLTGRGSEARASPTCVLGGQGWWRPPSSGWPCQLPCTDPLCRRAPCLLGAGTSTGGLIKRSSPGYPRLGALCEAGGSEAAEPMATSCGRMGSPGCAPGGRGVRGEAAPPPPLSPTSCICKRVFLFVVGLGSYFFCTNTGLAAHLTGGIEAAV